MRVGRSSQRLCRDFRIRQDPRPGWPQALAKGQAGGALTTTGDGVSRDHRAAGSLPVTKGERKEKLGEDKVLKGSRGKARRNL